MVYTGIQYSANQLLRSSIVSTKGLLNGPGQNNCFLNCAVQVSHFSLNYFELKHKSTPFRNNYKQSFQIRILMTIKKILTEITMKLNGKRIELNNLQMPIVCKQCIREIWYNSHQRKIRIYEKSKHDQFSIFIV